MKKILLVHPHFDPEVTEVQTRVMNLLSAKAFMKPLSVTTVAALTPDDIEVDIWDEAVQGRVTDETDLKKDYDLVGVTGYINHLGRAIAISRTLRSRGIPVAVGGPGVSSAPEHYREHFDVLFIGEAEYTWPQFIAEFKRGSHRREYRQVSKVDMKHSPAPRWDKVAADMRHYLVGSLQTTRGCPFDCEFCDVIYIFGRQPRHKSIQQVLDEVCALERLGAEHIFVCDDNFYGDPRYAKSLLRELIPLNRSFRYPLIFNTQINLNIAKDEEMLELLADANFTGLFIGVETPNRESLTETNKPQKNRADIAQDVKKIQSYGLVIQAGMIVGFDHDDNTIFDQQFDFLQETCVPNPLVNTLKAPIGTKLWVRLHKEGRVVQRRILQSTTSTDEPLTNIIPKQMTRVELLSGYRDLVQRIREWRNFEARVKGMISQVSRRPNLKRRPFPWERALKFLWYMFFHADRDARGTTLRLLYFTFRRAPYMMVKVTAMIARQYVEVAQLPNHLARIDEQIRLETKEGTQLERIPKVFFVPDGFRKPYKDLFPDLYRRVFQGLANKSRTHDALVEAIYDFLTRWGDSFQEFEDYHRNFLYEICDRTIVKENDRLVAGARGDVGAKQLPDEMADLSERETAMRLSRLADEVLHFVEQEMRSLQTHLPESESQKTAS